MALVIAAIGFSVVEPMSLMTPLSMAGRTLSDCDLDQRWHSSSSRKLSRPYSLRLPSALSITSRTSFTPLVTAFSL